MSDLKITDGLLEEFVKECSILYEKKGFTGGDEYFGKYLEM